MAITTEKFLKSAIIFARYITAKLLLQEEYNERSPQISPDGRWLAYMSDESGQSEVFVRPFPDVDSGGKRQVSTDGGYDPLWSPDGMELFYVGSDNEAMAVSIKAKPTFRLGIPQSLFARPYLSGDIDSDGGRFLMVKEVETTEDDSTQGTPHKINIILNWFEELKERVPID